MPVHLFGIRHHGPGSARSLCKSLGELRPDILLIEGPLEAEKILELAGHTEMKPPVAMLFYPKDQAAEASYYPFAEFSPEWQAIQWALKEEVPIRMIDLPQAIDVALQKQLLEQQRVASEEALSEIENQDSEPMESEETLASDVDQGPFERKEFPTWQARVRFDPIGVLAEAAGYADRELFWEQQIERREDSSGVFEAIAEAMEALRETAPELSPRDELREAFMRQGIRKAIREKHEEIAVVCGAWHVPALQDLKSHAKADRERVKKLPKEKITGTWIPWSNSKLTSRSGYGAGVESPGWYEQIWQEPKNTTLRWISRAARLLRKEDLEASPASVIEAVRLAKTLAILRDLQSPGLQEMNEALQTVFCQGNQAPLKLIHQRLEVGYRLGSVPRETPALPVQEDLNKTIKKLRLKKSTSAEWLELDLRKDQGLARSHLFHRLNLLHIPWAVRQEIHSRTKGTFREAWEVQWDAEFEVKVIEASIWGNSIHEAATNCAIDQAGKTNTIVELTELLDQAMLADLSNASIKILSEIHSKSAHVVDLDHIMFALLPLARIARYSDVRNTQAEQILPIIHHLFERLIISLPISCASLNDEAAKKMTEGFEKVHTTLDLLNDDHMCEQWHRTFQILVGNDSVHGLLRGMATRRLFEQEIIDDRELYRQARLSLSRAFTPLMCTHWLEGLLSGAALLLIHQDGIWQALDEWMMGLDSELFSETVPLLRRSFSNFQPAERRRMSEKIKHLSPDLTQGNDTRSDKKSAQRKVNQQRADQTLPVLAELLGVKFHGS